MEDRALGDRRLIACRASGRRAVRITAAILCGLWIPAAVGSGHAAPIELRVPGHPRLYLTADDLPRLRELRTCGQHARIWANLADSADWCRQQKPRSEWIAPLMPDPIYENLYDRFYAAMHDTAIVEHLAFASILSDPRDDPYFVAAREWLLASARVWKNEASQQPDASKAYAVLRIMKALAVGYDLLYERLSESERAEVRDALLPVCRGYYQFFQDPGTAGEGYNKHHGSVDAAPLGVVALSLLGEVPEAELWLELMVDKHVKYLLPHALTPSGTNEQSSNFWASTLHYRIFFLDALRRVTGRDLFAEHPDALPGRIALAAIAAGQPRGLRYNEVNRSVLFGPCYGQIDYWSPVLLFIARQQQRPIFQYLALWDESLGAIQHTRYITPTRKEELLFELGGYAYLWYDQQVPAAVEAGLPLSFEFPEPEVNEAYLRASYEPNGLVAGILKGQVLVHAGGRAVFVDRLGAPGDYQPSGPVDEMLVADDGRQATIRCVGPKQAEIGQQRVTLARPGKVTIRRETDRDQNWWYAGEAVRQGNSLTWPDNTRLEVTRGRIVALDSRGYVETKVHYGGMKYADPHPMAYPLVTVRPDQQVLEVVITTGRPK